MPLQKLLQTSWDPGRYQAGMGNDVAVEREGARGHESASVPEITEAVRSNVFWSFGAMILMLGHSLCFMGGRASMSSVCREQQAEAVRA